jgi:hypothetical protein
MFVLQLLCQAYRKLAEHGMKQALKQQTQTSGQTPPKAAKKRV